MERYLIIIQYASGRKHRFKKYLSADSYEYSIDALKKAVGNPNAGNFNIQLDNDDYLFINALQVEEVTVREL